MTSPADADALLEHDAHTLSRLWLDRRADWTQASAAVEPLLSDARTRAEPRSAWLSLAFEALHWWVFRPGSTETAAAVQSIRQQLQATGWVRAVQLADAAWALLHTHERQFDEQVLALLAVHDAAGDPPRPAAERVWTANAQTLLYAGRVDFDEALVFGLRAEALAQEAGHDSATLQAAQGLAYIFLSAGDMEGAEAVLPTGIAAGRRWGWPTLGLHYNQLLTWVVGGRFAKAAHWLEHDKALQDKALMDRTDAVRALVALAWAQVGRGDEARALLAQPPLGMAPDSSAMRANTVWMRGAAWLALGEHVRACTELETGIGQLADSGAPLSPLNGTQLYRVLSEACEAGGDFRASLAALKRSQVFCFQWVGASMRSRLQALSLATDGAGSAAQAQRLLAVEQALGRAELDEGDGALQRQRRFLQHVTHEMRNPLTGIIGMTSLLMMSDLDERQRKYTGMAQMSAHMLLALCNDVLDLAKLESGKFELQPEAVDVAELVHTATALFRPLAESKGLRLDCDTDPALPPALCCDRLRLQQVLMNLLSNACKFTGAGGITVSARWHRTAAEPPEPALWVQVQDTGPGLDAAAQARLFQEFSQIDAGGVHHPGGTGLGLALCRSLLDLMDGEIGVRSSPGQGSVFWFRLHLKPA